MKLKSDVLLQFGENDSAFCGPTIQSLQMFSQSLKIWIRLEITNTGTV